MKKLIIVAMAMMSFVTILAQKPQLKVDLSMTNRSQTEVGEEGFTCWQVPQGNSASTTIDGITCTLSTPAGADYVIRTGWNKSFIQNAENKAKNGRLTGDGISLDPASTTANQPNPSNGEIILTLEGLPVGTHTLQTYHSRWENPANFSGWPINVKVNDKVVYENVTTTFWEPVAANACMLTVTLKVEHEGAPVSVSFYTLEDQTPADVAAKTNKNMAPVINGFELNTVSVKAQAKDPYPNSGNLHADCDDKTCTLTWSVPSSDIVKHLVYIGSDSASVAQMTVPTAETTDTCYTLSDLYSMNTYYWRVDEVDASGTATQGNVWYFRPRQLAFPGAEGYGRFATGGRGGIVYHVTNLSNDMEPGSFIYGLKGLTGPRTIVFDVSGIITMSEKPTENMPSVFANPFVTIAPQTAPGKGICLRYCNLGIGAESIVRHLRAKRGYGADGVTGNAIGLNTDNSILDHVTAAWGTDETFSSRGAKMITFQYSMIAEALGITGHKNYPAGTNHGYAATIDGKIGTYSHNMLVNCEGRNWSLGGGMDGTNTAIGQMDIFNNVCYNWYKRTTDGGCHEVNFVNNYYKMGPDTKLTILYSQDYENVGNTVSKWQAYISGNIRENKNHTLTTDKQDDTYRYTLSNGSIDPNKRTDEYGYKTFVDKPFFPSYAVIHSAKDAFKIVTSTSGATMPCRDNQHVRVMNEAIKGTYTYVGSKSGIKGEIDREFDITAESATNGWEEWPQTKRPATYDTDQDGMPDWWEKATGSDPAVANNNDDPDHDGWTLLEDYLDFVAHPYVTVKAEGTATFDAAPEFCGFTKSPVFSVTTDSELFSAEINGSIITVKAKGESGVGTVNMTVTDGDGTSFTQRLGVCVRYNNDVSAIDEVGKATNEVAKREFFTLDGKKVKTLAPMQVYVMKVTYTDGTQETMKVEGM